MRRKILFSLSDEIKTQEMNTQESKEGKLEGKSKKKRVSIFI